MIVVKIWILSLIIAFSYAFIISIFLNNKYYPTNLKKFLIFISKMVPYYFFISSLILILVGFYIRIFIFKI